MGAIADRIALREASRVLEKAMAEVSAPLRLEIRQTRFLIEMANMMGSEPEPLGHARYKGE